jgi:hypothetical protein
MVGICIAPDEALESFWFFDRFFKFRQKLKDDKADLLYFEQTAKLKVDQMRQALIQLAKSMLTADQLKAKPWGLGNTPAGRPDFTRDERDDEFRTARAKDVEKQWNESFRPALRQITAAIRDRTLPSEPTSADGQSQPYIFLPKVGTVSAVVPAYDKFIQRLGTDAKYASDNAATYKAGRNKYTRRT